MARIETVTSPLLSDPPVEPEAPERAVDKNYADSVRAGYVETPDEWMARIGSRS
ncbi:hypothetical protein [Streptomyces sp. NPDC086989]|uniref:hypothetical protein n=1 Tax=Streptomyces sp. NPDC086989 TaxID=3365764 RepID=UPI00380C8C7A